MKYTLKMFMSFIDPCIHVIQRMNKIIILQTLYWIDGKKMICKVIR